jgi:hypothetical protein
MTKHRLRIKLSQTNITIGADKYRIKEKLTHPKEKLTHPGSRCDSLGNFRTGHVLSAPPPCPHNVVSVAATELHLAKPCCSFPQHLVTGFYITPLNKYPLEWSANFIMNNCLLFFILDLPFIMLRSASPFLFFPIK